MTAAVCRVLGAGVLAAVSFGAQFDPAEVQRGRQTYLTEGCPACHGRERQGGSMGPDLRRLKGHWRRQELVAYLGDPASDRQREARLQR